MTMTATPLSIDDLVQRTHAKRVGDSWMATCPCHPDDTPSLSVYQGNDGRPHLECHAGCAFKDICAALGIRFMDGQFYEAADLDSKRSSGREIEATYRYESTFGHLQFEAVRYRPKGFSQRRPDGKGGWIKDLKGVPRPLPLYRLPELTKAPTLMRIFLVEGEKDVHRLVDQGLVATCTAMGAGKSHHTELGPLTGYDVVIIPDNDKSGKAHAEQLAEKLHGKAASVVVLRPLVDKRGGDVSDFLDADHTIDDLIDLANDAPAWSPPDDSPGPVASGPTSAQPGANSTATDGDPEKPSPRLVTVRLSDVKSELLRWFWERRIPLGKLSILAGIQGIGKSFLALDMAARVSTGRAWPDAHDTPIPLGSVVILSAEDAAADTIRPRLDAAGADTRKIHIIEGVRDVGDDDDDEPRSFNLSRDLHLLGRHVKELGDVRLAVVDPLDSYLGERVDSHKSGDVRRVLHPLSVFAAHHKVAVVAVCHLNKSPNPQAIYRVIGSIAFTAAARAAWLVAPDRDDRDRRLFVPLKMNLAKPAPGLVFKIERGQLMWLDGQIDVTADEALAEGDDDHSPQSKVDEAIDFLKTALKNGAQRAKDIKKGAQDEGIREGALKEAKRQLGVKSELVFAKPSVWFWSLPEANLQPTSPVEGRARRP